MVANGRSLVAPWPQGRPTPDGRKGDSGPTMSSAPPRNATIGVGTPRRITTLKSGMVGEDGSHQTIGQETERPGMTDFNGRAENPNPRFFRLKVGP